ncbi:cytochrome P450 [Alkalilimnicola sp. S0819]|uniref:cytochrome P450 n=1 Tax=Alkalilimnicola sp. S0819 TaxID=2613922 RepID=UPI0012616581|nr:cytochrome P450 [Alkalilimnicola sp. S0819]KAB7619604.1 cytochrome P450 [Alkalilimnicola sp. S0819]MPQ17608.1 cytochrome P450 [Alkalilimnicola sp. S0819]
MTTQTQHAPARIDWWALLTDPDFLRDPFPALKRIREQAPVHHDAGSDIYFVLGHEAFRSLTRAPEMGRDTRLWTNGWSRPGNEERDPLSYQLFSEFQRQMVNANPPDHRRMRDVFEDALRPASLTRHRPMIEAEVRRLLKAVPDDTPVDFMSAFANHLPLRIVRNLFEIPPEMDAQLAQWNAALLKIGDIMMSPEQKQEALDALRAYKAYLREHLASHRAGAEQGFIGLALAACEHGALDEEEALNNLLGLISGNETTVTLLGNGMLSLLEHPEQLARLRGDTELMRPAVEEMLRYQPALNFILRVAISDFRCAGVHMPAGSLVIGLVPAINRDPARFDDPDVFDVARKPNAHSVFGGGAHVCIGKALARMQASAAFEALLARFPRIELAGEPVWWSDRTNQRGLRNLPMRCSRQRG